jgi:hypothetical protein
LIIYRKFVENNFDIHIVLILKAIAVSHVIGRDVNGGHYRLTDSSNTRRHTQANDPFLVIDVTESLPTKAILELIKG